MSYTAGHTWKSATMDLERSAMWGITTYFNPSRYQSRLANYRAFREGCRAQGLPLVTVELSPEGAEPELQAGRDAEVLVTKQSSVVLWHKERLLNLALETLPDSCRYVCWLDADVLFEDSDWVKNSVEQLEQHIVIQPFKHVIRLPRGKSPADYPSRRIGWRIRKGRRSGTYTPSFCSLFTVKRRRFGGTTGYAWCARRQLLDKHGFYDRCIVGGGDRELAFAFALPSDQVPTDELRIHRPKLRQHVQAWADAVYADVRGNIGFIDGAIHHLWHGESKDRNYQARHALLQEHDFDPERDLLLDDNGCWRWAPGAEALAQGVADYLGSRKEDG